MLSVLDGLRLQATSHPFVLALGFALAAWPAVSAWRRATTPATRDRIAAVAGATVLLAWAAIAAWYASNPQYFDPAEPTITAVGWIFTLGQPIYHEAASAERYAHIYGPIAFIAHGVALRVAGASIETSKWLGVLAGSGSLVLTWLALRGVTTRTRALALSGGCALVYLAFRNFTFWTRPEPLQLLCAAAALLAATRARGSGAAIAVGVATGLLTNLKITGPLYALPAVALLAHRTSMRLVGVAAGTAVVAAVLPFLLPGVSLAAYFDWLALSAHNGLELARLRQNLEWAGFLLLPLVAAYAGLQPAGRPRATEERVLAVTIVIGLCATAIAAAKPGAGPYHLLPFAPAIAFAIAIVSGDRAPGASGRWAAALAAGALAAAAWVAVARQASFIAIMRETVATDEAADIRAYLDAHPGEIVQMAYCAFDQPTFARPELTFRTGLYLFDAPAIQEHQLSGMTMPPAAIEAVRACRADAWLVPKGALPFRGPNRYPAMAEAPLFPAAFQTAFHAAYALDGSTRYFDVWRCRR